MKSEKKLYKITRFHDEEGVSCQSETVVSARSEKDAFRQALEENDIHVVEIENSKLK